MQGHFLFLGTSASMGVPVIGCKCNVCLSQSTFNKRRRCSAIIKVADKKILIDAGPELREQIVNANINAIDGALITHTHFDHIAAFDDLKAFCFCQKKKLPILLSRQSFEDLAVRYHYLIDSDSNKQGMFFDFDVIDDPFTSVNFGGVVFECLSYKQVNMSVTGIKIGNLAYLSDIKEYSEKLIESVSGIDILILSALRKSSSPMHLSLDEAIELSRKIGAKKTYFTHISHEIDHLSDSCYLPDGMEFAYDGLEIPFNYDKGIL